MKLSRFNYAFIFAFLLASVVVLGSFVSAEPFGANVTAGASSRYSGAATAGNNSAYAGNVTELIVRGITNTQTWQGYFGNVSGVIQLADAEDHVMYNWTTASPTGEIYASTNQTVAWVNIQCFNFTATGVLGSETGQGGTTSIQGINLTILESRFNIGASDVDGVNRTFNLIGAGTHDSFTVASSAFSEGECPNTRIYSGSGPTSNQFEEVLLYEPATTSVVFASLLEQDAAGFDSGTHDFEMLVLEDGHGTNTAATPYFFFVELQ